MLHDLKNRIDQSAGQAVLRLQQEVDAGAARVQFYHQRLAALQEATASSRNAQIKLRDLEREVSAGTQLYESLLQQQKDLETKGDALPDVRLVSAAGIPDESSSPNPLLFLLPAILCALILGAVVAILAERMDRRLRTARQVTQTLGVSCIGSIPEIKIPGGYKLHDALLRDPFSDYTESVRSVAVTCMGLTNGQGRGKTILVTSSRPKEGKTSLAVSLAFYSALMMKKVLLVDLDFRSSGILRELNEEADGGMLNVLAGLPVGEAIRHSRQKGLDYLPLPSTRADPAMILGNSALKDILEELKTRYDLIVIDTAPVLGSAETRLFAGLVDWVILAVRWHHLGDEVRQALAQLATSARGEPWTGRIFAVLTRVNLQALRRYEKADIAQGPSSPDLLERFQPTR
jgi:polysaccharide biosynthesis transport protein